MSHSDAIQAPHGRLLLAGCLVEGCRTLRRAAERFQISVSAASCLASVYVEHGESGMQDHSTRPARYPRAHRAADPWLR